MVLDNRVYKEIASYYKMINAKHFACVVVPNMIPWIWIGVGELDENR